MATIQFKGKVQQMLNMDDTLAYEYIAVPELKRNHCDMHAFRNHPKFGAYANSDLFAGMLKRIKSDTFKGGMLKLGQVPDGVQVDTKGFLAVVTIEV